MDSTEVPMLIISGEKCEKPEVAAETKHQYLATVVGKKNEKGCYKFSIIVLLYYCCFLVLFFI